MWVHGDLKERLGIKHRRELKQAAKSDIEQAPMFHRPHFRSESEISSFQPDIDGTPPHPRSPAATDSTHPSPHIRTSPLAVVHEDDNITPTATARNRMTPSPAGEWRGSYYSASNIPVPSPTPSPQPPMSSVNTQPISSSTLQIPALRARAAQQRPPEAFEMRVREPPAEDSATPTAYHPQEPTQSSYASAYDGFVDDADDDPHGHDGGLSASHAQHESQRDSMYSTNSGPTVL